MLPEKRRIQPVQWATIILLLTQLFSFIFTYGKFAERVEDMQARLIRLEAQMDRVLLQTR